MRLLDCDSNARLENIIIYLKKNEVTELIGALENLLSSEENASHHHVNDLEYTHEITVTMYNESNLTDFNQRSIQLIQQDV